MGLTILPTLHTPPWLSWSRCRSPRPPNTPISTIVLHETGPGNIKAHLKTLLGISSGRRVSSHYLISQLGVIYKLVPIQEQAWHAGQSFGPDGPEVNRYSIGIELQTLSRYQSAVPQLRSLRALLAILADTSATWLTSHRAIAVPSGRKVDGIVYDLHDLADAAGLTVWPK